ncbi:hypothetical protein EV426DRAFT_669278 [Tirmania nivea]|nr:hypothetical protein EV426DRAFT_669278 [Tirmania nivea]
MLVQKQQDYTEQIGIEDEPLLRLDGGLLFLALIVAVGLTFDSTVTGFDFDEDAAPAIGTVDFRIATVETPFFDGPAPHPPPAPPSPLPPTPPSPSSSTPFTPLSHPLHPYSLTLPLPHPPPPRLGLVVKGKGTPIQGTCIDLEQMIGAIKLQNDAGIVKKLKKKKKEEKKEGEKEEKKKDMQKVVVLVADFLFR